MTREEKYIEQMKALGTYHPAFDPEIHTLAEMERDVQRDRKDLKDGVKKGLLNAKAAAQLRADIAQARRDILAHRDALGLTPKALRRLKQLPAEPPEHDEKPPTVLALIQKKHQINA